MPTRAVFLVTHNIEEAVTLADRVIVLGKNPGRIRADFRISMPRPRDRDDLIFHNTVDYIYRVLTQPQAPETPRPEMTPAGTAGGTVEVRHQYQMLPHARPGGIAGLTELLLDRQGREEIHHLADDLALELDDILPIVEAAEMLGFIVVKEGYAEMTDQGRAFAEADILERKELFRVAASRRVSLIKQIRRALEAKANRSLPDEFFRDTLEEHFSEDETQRQLETAIHWGRYAELFDHDSATERFYIPGDMQHTASQEGAVNR
jgi:NitT/TauT family transport system ATP-binding protein